MHSPTQRHGCMCNVAQLCPHGYRAVGGTILVPALKLQHLLNAMLSIPGWADIDGTEGEKEQLNSSTQAALRSIVGAKRSPPPKPQRKSKRLAIKARQASPKPYWEITTSTKRQRYLSDTQRFTRATAATSQHIKNCTLNHRKTARRIHKGRQQQLPLLAPPLTATQHT